MDKEFVHNAKKETTRQKTFPEKQKKNLMNDDCSVKKISRY